MIEDMNSGVLGSRLKRLVDEVTEGLLNVNARDAQNLEGDAWLEAEKNGEIPQETESDLDSGGIVEDEVLPEATPASHNPKNRLQMGFSDVIADDEGFNVEDDLLGDIEDYESVEDESETTPKTIIAKMNPTKKKPMITIKPTATIKPRKVEVEDPSEEFEDIIHSNDENTVGKGVEVERPARLGAEISSQFGSSVLTPNQQNIKNVFEQVMGTERANQEQTAVDFINYCIKQTRNTFGLKTTLQEIDFIYGDPDRITSKAQEKWDEIELAKYYLQYLLEEVEFLRYLEPKEELLIPKIEARVLNSNFEIKDIPVVESTLEVYSSFATGRDYGIMPRLLKISTDMFTGREISQALQDVKGRVVITVDSKTKFPEILKDDLSHSRLTFTKITGKDVQEQVVNSDTLKYTDTVFTSGFGTEDIRLPESSIEELVEAPTEPEASVESEPEAWNWEEETAGQEEQLAVENVPVEEQVVIESVEAPVMPEVVEEKDDVAELNEEVERLDDETYRALLKFIAMAVDVDYKSYLRMSQEDQESDLLLDIQNFLQDDSQYKREYQISLRLKELYNPLYEVMAKNGYDIERLRSVEDFSDVDLSFDEFDKKDTIYLHQILIAIKEIWVKVTKQAEAELLKEQEREEAERLAQAEAERALEEQEEAETSVEEIEPDSDQEEADNSEFDEDQGAENGDPDSEPEMAEGGEKAEETEAVESQEGSSEFDEGEDDWLEGFESENVNDDFKLDDLQSQIVNNKKVKKSKKFGKKKAQNDTGELVLDGASGSSSQGEKNTKKVVTISVVAFLSILGGGIYGLHSLSNHLNGNATATTQSSKPAEHKINVLKGVLDENSQVTFIDKNNSNKLTPNPYDKLVMAHSDKVSDDQLKKLGLTEKTSLTITDSGEQVAITISGVVTSKDANITGVSQLKDVDYLKWVDSNNVPYFMPFKL